MAGRLVSRRGGRLGEAQLRWRDRTGASPSLRRKWSRRTQRREAAVVLEALHLCFEGMVGLLLIPRFAAAQGGWLVPSQHLLQFGGVSFAPCVKHISTSRRVCFFEQMDGLLDIYQSFPHFSRCQSSGFADDAFRVLSGTFDIALLSECCPGSVRRHIAALLVADVVESPRRSSNWAFADSFNQAKRVWLTAPNGR